MTFYLVCTQGGCKGRIWGVVPDWTTVGRAAECEIVLDDDSISRRHCRIRVNNERIELEDLKSLNPVLVNGSPVKHAVLRAGDELAVGSSKLMVVGDSGDAMAAEGAGGRQRPTVSWDKIVPIWLRPDAAKDQIPTRPGTIQDLAFLYDTARALNELHTLDDVFGELSARLRERFRPLQLWIARVAGPDSVELVVGSDAAASFPLGLVQDSLKKGHGLLVPKMTSKSGKRICQFTLLAPVSGGGVMARVLVLYTETPYGAYDGEDLRLLVLLSQLLGPILYSVRALEQLRWDNEYLSSVTAQPAELLGESRVMGHVRRLARQAAASHLHVLITGETGTGKELVARIIHEQGPNRTQPFVIVNCAAIPKDLFESEFFGYEKGAFTGAERSSEGLLSQANGGTLFLDEVGDLSLENQARILRAIELGTFRRIGGKQELQVRVRVVAATNKDLAAAIQEGAFRKDLYHRLSGFEINIPPLREHPSDIRILAEHFLLVARQHAKRPLKGFSAEAIRRLEARLWPGNVRELRNCILRSALAARHEEIQAEDIQSGGGMGASGESEQVLRLAEMEKRHIETVLRQCGGSIREAAKLLGIGRSTLYVKIAEHNIS